MASVEQPSRRERKRSPDEARFQALLALVHTHLEGLRAEDAALGLRRYLETLRKLTGCTTAFLAEFEGKRCLFAGDAHPSVLEDSIQRLLEERGEPCLQLDAFKLPHHGSKANLSPDLLRLLACDLYLVSTNGSYFGHPDQEAIARILLHGGDEPTLLFNYRCEENEVWDDEILMDDFGFWAVYPAEDHQGLVLEL